MERGLLDLLMETAWKMRYLIRSTEETASVVLSAGRGVFRAHITGIWMSCSMLMDCVQNPWRWKRSFLVPFTTTSDDRPP